MRKSLVAAAVVGAVAASGAIGYRVLAPAETLTPASGAYPAPSAHTPGVIGSIGAAPLVVDGRLRVYATTRQVRADGPVDARTQRTPYWSYRRWPEQLLGVVAAGGAVVSRWSDGELVALDARTGRVAWRLADGPPADAGYDGGSTGARTVYEPEGLHTGPAGRVLVREPGRLRAIDAATGREVWRTSLQDCLVDGFATRDGWYAATDTCTSPWALTLYDPASGRGTRWVPPDAGAEPAVEPVGCGTARSDCAGMRTGGNGVARGWVFESAQPVATPALDTTDSSVTGDVVVAARDGVVIGQSRGGTEMWRWRVETSNTNNTNSAELLATQPGAVHLLTEDRQLVTLDPATGHERSRFVLAYGRERTKWVLGHVAARDGYVVVERMAAPAGSDDYFSVTPVILART